MKQIRFRLILLIVAITLQIAWYAVLMVSFIRTPGKLEGADFLTYYSVGRVASQHGLSRVYDLDLEAAAQAEITGVAVGVQYVLPANHPPFLYPYLEFLARLPYREAYNGYTALLGTLAIIGLIFLGCALEHNGWPRGQVYMTLAGVLLFEPLFISILKGQDSALLLLGGLLWLSGLSRNDDRLAGLGLSMTLIRPQIALLLGLPFLCRQRKSILPKLAT